jgi:hypothetical protein
MKNNTQRRRRCEVNGKPAIFHRWVDEDKAVLHFHALIRTEEMRNWTKMFNEEGAAPSSCSVKVLRATFALVEYRDGTVDKVKPEAIRFMDKRRR